MKEDIRTFKGLRDRLLNWYHTINGKSGQTLIVTIARKGPRLYEYCRSISQEEGRVSVISEHALPFVLNADFCKKYTNVVLADEAIYHGTTFERIYSLLLTGFYMTGRLLDKNNIESIPAVVAEAPQAFEKFIKIKDQYRSSITEKEIPFYIDSIISGFQSLGKPYDIEFPLFYIETGLPKDENIRIAENIAKTLKSSFGEDKIYYYVVDHWNRDIMAEEGNTGWSHHVQNISIVLDGLIDPNRDIVKPEFFKVRIYVKDKRICIASFAPHIIPEDYVGENTSLFEGSEELKKIWKEIYSGINFFRGEENAEYRKYITRKVDDTDAPQKLDYFWERQKQEYQYHCKKTLIICANYLLSFYYLSKLSDPILSVMKEVGGCNAIMFADLEDLQYLFGEELAVLLKSQLDKLIETEIHLRNNIISEISQCDVIPAVYKAEFEKQNIADFQKCKSVSELVSSNFSNQHRLVELKSRGEYTLSDRLRYGESFSSLYRKFILFTPDGQITQDLHHSLDQRIDEGSIVPNYVCVSDVTHGFNPFIRMFRSGENEDKSKDQLLRIVYYIAWRISIYRKVSKVDERLLTFVFHLVFVNPVSVRPFRNLCGIFYEACYNKEGIIRVSFSYGGAAKYKDLIDYAVTFNVLEELESELSDRSYMLCMNDYTDLMGRTTMLDAETEQLLNLYLDAALFVNRRMMDSSINELQQWYICKKQNKEYAAKLEYWNSEHERLWDSNNKISLDSEGKDNPAEETLLKEAYDAFNNLFVRYPINDLSDERKTVVSAYKTEDRSTEELTVINTILPDFIAGDAAAKKLMQTIRGIYLIFILLMARKEQSTEKKEIILYCMQELAVNFGSMYPPIACWNDRKLNLEHEFEKENVYFILLELLKSIINKYLNHDEMDGYFEKHTSRTVAEIS